MLSFLSPLGWYWIAVPLAAAGFGVLLLLTGIGHLFGGRPGRASVHSIIGAPFAIVGLAASLLALNTQSFARLSHEGDAGRCEHQGARSGEQSL